MRFDELLTRIVWQAQRGGETFELAEQDAIAIAEAMFITMADAVSMRLAASQRTRTLLQRTVSITVTNGEGPLPDEVLTKYINSDGVWIDPAPTATTKRYSYLPFDRFVAKPITPLGLFTVLGEQRVLQREPTSLYVAGSGITGNRELTVPCRIIKPVSATTDLGVVPEVDEMLINTGAEMLRGKMASVET